MSPSISVEPLVAGSLRSASPVLDLPKISEGAIPRCETFVATDSFTSFRALDQPALDGAGIIVMAVPLQEVDDAMRRLERTLARAGLSIAAVLAALSFWIQRRGITPISRVTETADTITAGAHRLRAPDGETG